LNGRSQFIEDLVTVLLAAFCEQSANLHDHEPAGLPPGSGL
jgi:hypothetical protein